MGNSERSAGRDPHGSERQASCAPQSVDAKRIREDVEWEGCTEKRGDVENLLEAIANNGEKETSAAMIYDDEE